MCLLTNSFSTSIFWRPNFTGTLALVVLSLPRESESLLLDSFSTDMFCFSFLKLSSVTLSELELEEVDLSFSLLWLL